MQALNDYFEVTPADEDAEDVEDAEDEPFTQPSFMLDFFGFREENLPYTVLVLTLMFIFYRILGYIILRGKVKEIRLS